MPTPAYIITCTKRELIAPHVYELRFTKPDELVFKAGQFVLFDVPSADNAADIQPRAYSIASAPEEKELIFVVKLKAGGRASIWIESSLAVGTEVRVQGPFGLFTVKDEAELVFVATGAGIAPFRSQIIDLLKTKSDARPLHLLFGVREPEDFFWTKEFEDLVMTYKNFHFHPTLSGQDTSWMGLRGRVHSHLPLIFKGHTKTGVYICGAPEMVKDVKEACLHSLHLPKEQVHAEGYI